MRRLSKWAAACVLAGVCGGLYAADWPGYRGVNTDAVVADGKLPGKLEVTEAWKVPLGNGFGQIAVSGDKALALIERGKDEVAVCLDVKTGKEVWATTIDASIRDGQGGDGPRSTPAISGDRVYIYGTHMKLVCLNLADGKEAWSHSVKNEFGGKELHWGNAASPVVVDDTVIVVAGGGGDDAKGVLAFDKNSGKVVWSSTNEKCTHATPTVATIEGKKQVICFMQSGLVSVDPKDGSQLWKFEFPIKTAAGASPVVGGEKGDIVFCSAGYGVGAAACRVFHDGDKWVANKLWATPKQNSMHWSSPVCKGSHVYGLIGPNNSTPPEQKGNLACIDINTGNVIWEQRSVGAQGGLIMVGDKLLVATPFGDLLMVEASPNGFKELGRKNVLPAKDWTPPSYANGMVFMRNTTDGSSKAEAVCLKLDEN